MYGYNVVRSSTVISNLESAYNTPLIMPSSGSVIVPSKSKNTYLYILVLQVQNDALSCNNTNKTIPVIYHTEKIPIQNPFHNLIFFYSI